MPFKSNKWSNRPETISEGLKLWMVCVCLCVHTCWGSKWCICI